MRKPLFYDSRRVHAAAFLWALSLAAGPAPAQGPADAPRLAAGPAPLGPSSLGPSSFGPANSGSASRGNSGVASLADVGDDFFDLAASPESDPAGGTSAGGISIGGDSIGGAAIDQAERPKPPAISPQPDSLAGVGVAGAEEQTLSPELQAWVRWFALKNLPPSYEDNRKWGKTAEVYDGFRLRREGLKVETYRKWKTVKQGTWSRYFIEWIDPENTLQLRVDRLRAIDDRRFGFRVAIEMPLHLFARVARWQRDVQLISLSTNADAVVSLSVDCETAIEVIPLSFPPEIRFLPRATAASIEVVEFRVERISQIQGEPARRLGEGLRKVLDRRIEEYEVKLVDKINRQIDKHADRLYIRLQDKLTAFLSSMPVGSTTLGDAAATPP